MTPETYEDEPQVGGWSWPGTVGSWNWPGYEGKPVRVDVYAKADEAELIINGESLGRQAILQESVGQDVAYRTVFDTVYTPGKIETVVYTAGVETGRFAIETADEDVEMEVTVDRAEIRADDTDLAYVDVALRDAQGRLNTAVVRTVSVSVEGAGILQGLGSSNPCPEGNYFDSECPTYHGQVLAAIRPTGVGEITVKITAEGCKPVTVTIVAK